MYNGKLDRKYIVNQIKNNNVSDRKISPFENRIETVSIGETAYLSFESVIVTEIGVFIHILSEVLFLTREEVEQKQDDIIEITRLRSGFSPKSWRFNTFRAKKFCLCIESESEADSYLAKEEDYIFFPSFKKKKPTTPPVVIPVVDVEQLEKELQQSLNDQKYEEAAEIRDQMKKLQTK